MSKSSFLDKWVAGYLNISREIERVLRNANMGGLKHMLMERDIYLRLFDENLSKLKDNRDIRELISKMEIIRRQDEVNIDLIRNRIDSLKEKLYKIKKEKKILKKYADPSLTLCPQYIEVWK